MNTEGNHSAIRLAARILCMLLCVAMTSPVKAVAQSIDSVFINVPTEELPLLEHNPRLDMLDLYNYNMTANGENIFGRNSVMTEKSENHIVVQLTDVSRWELMRLRADTATVYACLHTVTAPIGLNRLRVYDASWKQLEGFSLPAPSVQDFVIAPDSLNAETAEIADNKLKTAGAIAHWETETPESRPTLTLEVVTSSLSLEDRAKIQPCLRPLRYAWNGKGFEPVSQ